jgi:hypothetical protein
MNTRQLLHAAAVALLSTFNCEVLVASLLMTEGVTERTNEL